MDSGINTKNDKFKKLGHTVFSFISVDKYKRGLQKRSGYCVALKASMYRNVSALKNVAPVRNAVAHQLARSKSQLCLHKLLNIGKSIPSC